MIESTLSYLGKFLGERSGLGNKKIVFHEKEQIFTFLKDNSLPRELPIVSYYMSNVADPMEMKSQRRVKGDYNKNFTTVEAATIVPVKLDITIALVSNKLTDYFSLLNFYFSINNSPKFTVAVDSDEVKGEFEASITELNSLSTPAFGEESKDYDKGKYRVMEGSFSVSTYLVYITEEKVVRRIGFDTNLTPEIVLFK